MSNYEGDSIELNAKDSKNNPSQFLGDFYKASEICTAINDPSTTGNMYKKYHTNFAVRDDGYGFRVTELTQPIAVEDVEKNYTESDYIIRKTASVTNTYEPDESNFEGKIVVNKTWDDKDKENDENTLNTADFNSSTVQTKNAHDYTFTVSRRTPRLPEKSLFSINTWDITAERPTVGVIDETGFFNINLNDPMKKYTAAGNHIQDDSNEPVGYYEKDIIFDKAAYTGISGIPITIKIWKTPDKYNQVEIDGLAIYGQDAVMYTYKINETGTVSAQTNTTADTGDMEAYTFIQPEGKRMVEDNSTASFDLRNELKVFTLNLYKVFGKKYDAQDGTGNKTDILDPGDYNQYFNDEYVNNLRFILERKKGVDGIYERYNYSDNHMTTHNPVLVEADSSNKKYSVEKVMENGKLKYYRLQFKNLPKYSADGYVYYYRVTEIAPTGNDVHYTTTYTTSSSEYGGSTAIDVNCGENESTKNTYVRNNFESKQITVNKYWNDENNNLKGTVGKLHMQQNSIMV